MTPVKNDGATDTGRKVIYVGETQLMTPVGALPLAFEIEATRWAMPPRVRRSRPGRGGRLQSGSFRKCAAGQLVDRHPRSIPSGPAHRAEKSNCRKEP